MQKARLIPVSGIWFGHRGEQRATSALLGVLTVVRDLSTELLAPLGASRAHRAIVEAFTEVTFKLNGKKIRPDGLITVSYGNTSWACLVEVKTGENSLEAEQINAYWDIARSQGFDHVLTISNEIAPNEKSHPSSGLRVRANSPVQVSHYSWTAILTTAVRIKQHKGVSDPEQAWILDELIRYLEHPASGALAFEDMGPYWVTVRDAARSGTLSKRTEGIEDVCARWDQLVRYAALKLGSEIGQDVTHLLPRSHRDPDKRLTHLIDSLTGTALLDASLRIPNTAGDLQIAADLRGQHLTASLDIDAPQDKGARGRLTWLVNQLQDAAPELIIESYAKNARTPTTATLAALRDDRSAGIDQNRREAHKFKIVAHAEMGKGRKTGQRNPGFITTILNLIDKFYEDIVQDIKPWQPPTPKLKRLEQDPPPDTNTSETVNHITDDS